MIDSLAEQHLDATGKLMAAAVEVYQVTNGVGLEDVDTLTATTTFSKEAGQSRIVIVALSAGQEIPLAIIAIETEEEAPDDHRQN